MGYSPGFLVKIGRFQTLGNSYEIFTNKPQSSYKSFCKHVGDVSGSLGRFLALTEIRPLQNHGRPGVLVKIGPFQAIGNSYEIFTNKPRKRWKSICKHVVDVSGSLGRFVALTQIRPLQNHGL